MFIHDGRIERIVAKDSPIQCSCYLDASRKQLWATNGMALAIWDGLGLDETETSGFISTESIIAARKAKSALMCNGSATVVLSGIQYPRPEHDMNQRYVWPKSVPAIIDNAGSKPEQLRIDSKLLYDLALAVGDGKESIVTLSWSTGPDGRQDGESIKVQVSGSTDYGLIMPCQPR